MMLMIKDSTNDSNNNIFLFFYFSNNDFEMAIGLNECYCNTNKFKYWSFFTNFFHSSIQRLHKACIPSSSWGPADPLLREKYRYDMNDTLESADEYGMCCRVWTPVQCIALQQDDTTRQFDHKTRKSRKEVRQEWNE